MRLHPRYAITRRAECDISEAIWAAMNKHDLTYIETLRAIAVTQNDIMKYMLRNERHPKDPDLKADEAA